MNKWTKLKHYGPIFPLVYKVKNLNIIINDNKYQVSSLAEEMIYAWSQKHATDYIKDVTFQKNFWKYLKPQLNKELQSSKFPKEWDFREFIAEIENVKELKKLKTKEDKKIEKEEREIRKEKYGFAILNGEKTSLGNYMVEPPGLFMGRGKHPLRGSWKSRINPEDIIINHSLDSNPPQAPEGHKWGSVIENKNSFFTTGWYCKLTDKFKPILFSATSSVSHESAKKKFSKAIELANNFDKVNEFIEKKLRSRDKMTRQIATVCELISKMSIRVGDEKSSDQADTVGATTLRVEHIKIDGTALIFDFLGKDSIRYYNRVESLDINAIRNIEEFINGKESNKQIFDAISSRDVNEFLGIVIDGLTAKQFRTATGSTLLAKELQLQRIDSSLPERKKLEYYTEANLEVAIKLNHQTAVSEAYEKSLKNMKIKLKSYKKELSDKKKTIKIDLQEAKDMRDKRVSYAKEKYKGQKQKESIRRAKTTFKNKEVILNKRISSLTERIENLKSKIIIKDKTKGVACGTSKLNYSDPRIAYSWCKKNDVDIKRIYTKTIQDRFIWAKDIDEDFYLNYPGEV